MKEKDKSFVDKEISRGMIKLMILSYIKRNKTYPYAILKFIQSARDVHGVHALEGLTKSDIYNLTSQLEKDEYIKGKAKLQGNKVQKMFTITKKGDAIVRNKERIFRDAFTALKRLIESESFA